MILGIGDIDPHNLVDWAFENDSHVLIYWIALEVPVYSGLSVIDILNHVIG